jgi:hypothetical protein
MLALLLLCVILIQPDYAIYKAEYGKRRNGYNLISVTGNAKSLVERNFNMQEAARQNHKKI